MPEASLMLLIATLAILVGPLLGTLGTASAAIKAGHDGFSLVLVTALCVIFVLPHVGAELGWQGLIPLLAGAAVPVLLRGLRSRVGWVLLLGLLALHAVFDGAVLALTAHDHHHHHDLAEHALPWAVIAHRLPVGFALLAWALRVAPSHRAAVRITWGCATLIIGATLLGFGGGAIAVDLLPARAPEVIEALVAGMLLSVILQAPGRAHELKTAAAPASATGSGETCAHHHHGHHPHGHHHHSEAPTHWAGLGALIGVITVFALLLAGDAAPPNSVIGATARTFWALLLETAPALLLGFALAGIVPYLMTGAALASLRRGGRLRQAARGVLYGLPLPVCSCGVLPVYQSLVQRGVPPAAALAFFVATPELGLDALLLSVPLLGESLTIARVCAAVAVALLVALLIRPPQPAAVPGPASSEPDPEQPLAQRLGEGLRFGFVEVFDHTMPWILLGLVIAALGEPLLREGALQDVPAFLQVPLAAVISVPLYVCAAGATPIAALAIHKGLSAGAAMAFLIAGPATNVTTFGVLARLHGRQTAFKFGACVAVLAIVAGWLVDLLGVQAVPMLPGHAPLDTHESLVGPISATILLLLLAASTVRQGPRGMIGQIITPIHSH
ncbi:MAG: permease [Pseudomonadota bacterium]